MAAFAAWAENGDVSKEKVLEYNEHLRIIYAPSSVNSVLASLNSFFDYKGFYGLKVKNLKIQRQIFARKDKELTKQEYERLLKAEKNKGSERLYMPMQTICATGIRVSELQYITVRAINSGRSEISLKGKSRIVIIPANLCRILKKYAAEQKIKRGSIFISKTGKPLDRSNIWKMLKALCASANVSESKVFPHNFRRLFARTYYSLEKDIVRLADILGHSSIETTRIYTMEGLKTENRLSARKNIIILESNLRFAQNEGFTHIVRADDFV